MIIIIFIIIIIIIILIMTIIIMSLWRLVWLLLLLFWLRTRGATRNVVSGCVLHHRVQNHWTPWWDLVGVAVRWHPGLQIISGAKTMDVQWLQYRNEWLEYKCKGCPSFHIAQLSQSYSTLQYAAVCYSPPWCTEHDRSRRGKQIFWTSREASRRFGELYCHYICYYRVHRVLFVCNFWKLSLFISACSLEFLLYVHFEKHDTVLHARA